MTSSFPLPTALRVASGILLIANALGHALVLDPVSWGLGLFVASFVIQDLTAKAAPKINA